LHVLAKKDVLLGLKNVDLEKYSHCMAGKQTKVSFKRHYSLKEVKVSSIGTF
jgi:hypothetical protein